MTHCNCCRLQHLSAALKVTPSPRLCMRWAHPAFSIQFSLQFKLFLIKQGLHNSEFLSSVIPCVCTLVQARATLAHVAASLAVSGGAALASQACRHASYRAGHVAWRACVFSPYMQVREEAACERSRKAGLALHFCTCCERSRERTSIDRGGRIHLGVMCTLQRPCSCPCCN